MNTTQGTAGLIGRLKALRARKDDAYYCHPEERETLDEAIAALSAKPAPVEAKTEREWQLLLNAKAVWMDSQHAYFIALSDAEEMVTGRPATAARPMSPAPELAVADEGRFEELLAEVLKQKAELTHAQWHESATAIARYKPLLESALEALRAYFKTSRSPVQEGMVMVSRDALAFWLNYIERCTADVGGGRAARNTARKYWSELQSALSTPGTGGSNG